MSAPRWLAEEVWLRQLLIWFLDRLGAPRTQAITRRISVSTVPALYEFGTETRYRWQLIESLANEHGIFTIQYNKRRNRSQEIYENAQLRLNSGSEGLLREWLGRPRQAPVIEAWRSALSVYSGNFQDQGAVLFTAQPCIPGYTPLELVAAFAAIEPLLQQPLTLREISARCFRGNSKFLDQKQELLNSLFGVMARSIQTRPLLLTAWAPPDFGQLLIVENQDNFLRLVENPPALQALLYSGGFRASASRLNSEHTRFAFLPGSEAQGFQDRWLSTQLPAYFWGDLDFAGMAILKTLRQTLPQLQAWQPGYQPMLEHLRSGGGHLPEQAGKTRQIDPGETGCIYSDSELLPALRETQRFVDQEMVRP